MRATDPTIPRAASARRASGGRHEGVATGTPSNLSGIISVRGATFSDEMVALAAASALTLPVQSHRHSGISMGAQAYRAHANEAARVRYTASGHVRAAVLRLASPAWTRSSC
jgi:hypothetical protein